MRLQTKLKYTTVAVATALSLAIIPSVNAASVTIENAGFESSFDNWSDTDPSAISSDKNSGSYAAKITGSAGKFEQDVTVEANTDYELTAYIKGAGKIGASVDGTRYTSTGGGSDYEKVTVSFNSGSFNTVTIFGNYDDAEGRFDDFALESTGETTPIDGEPTSVPGLIQSEDYSDFSDTTSGNKGGEYTDDDVDVQTTTDTDGGYNVGWIKSGEWLEYPITVSASGDYTADIRLASSKSTGKFNVLVDGSTVDSVSLASTGGWQNWETQNVDLGSLSAGEHTIRIAVTGDDFNMNWIDVKKDGVVVIPGNCNIDMSIWGYTTGDGVSMNDADDIQDLIDNKTLGSNGAEEIIFNDGCVTFQVENDAASSGGSTYPRSELRELLAEYNDSSVNVKGLTKNNWVTSDASSSNQALVGGVDGKLNATLVVNTVSVDATSDDQIGRIVVGQIHGENHEPVKIYYRKLPEHSKGSVFFTVDGSDGDPSDRINVIGFTDKNDTDEDASGDPVDPSNGIALGDEWSYEIDLTGDQLKVTVWHDGYTYTTSDSIAYTKTRSKQLISNSSDSNAITIEDFYAEDYMYFKAGLYNQNKTGTESPTYASVTFSVIDVTHD